MENAVNNPKLRNDFIMQANIRAQYECMQSFSGAVFNSDSGLKNYIEKNTELQRRIVQLTNAITEMEARNRNPTEPNQETLALRLELEKCRNKRSRCTQTVASCKSENRSLKAQLRKIQEEHNSTAAEIAASRAIVKEMDLDIDNIIQDDYDNGEMPKDDRIKELLQIKGENEIKIKELNSQLEELSKRFSDYAEKQTKSTSNKNINALVLERESQEELYKCEKKAKNYEIQLNSQDQQIRALKDKIESIHCEIKDNENIGKLPYEAANRALQNKIQQYENKIKEFDDKIAIVSQQRDQLDQDKKRLNDENSRLSKSNDDIKDEINVIDKERQECSQQVNRLNFEIKGLNSRIAQLQKHRKTAWGPIESNPAKSTDDVSAKLRVQNEILQERINEANSLLKKNQNERDKLQRDLTETRDQIRQERSKPTVVMKTDNDEYLDKINELNHQIQKLQSQNGSLTEELENLKSRGAEIRKEKVFIIDPKQQEKIKELENELDELKGDNGIIKSKYEKLQREIDYLTKKYNLSFHEIIDLADSEPELQSESSVPDLNMHDAAELKRLRKEVSSFREFCDSDLAKAIKQKNVSVILDCIQGIIGRYNVLTLMIEIHKDRHFLPLLMYSVLGKLEDKSEFTWYEKIVLIWISIVSRDAENANDEITVLVRNAIVNLHHGDAEKFYDLQNNELISRILISDLADFIDKKDLMNRHNAIMRDSEPISKTIGAGVAIIGGTVTSIGKRLLSGLALLLIVAVVLIVSFVFIRWIIGNLRGHRDRGHRGHPQPAQEDYNMNPHQQAFQIVDKTVQNHQDQNL